MGFLKPNGSTDEKYRRCWGPQAPIGAPKGLYRGYRKIFNLGSAGVWGPISTLIVDFGKPKSSVELFRFTLDSLQTQIAVFSCFWDQWKRP